MLRKLTLLLLLLVSLLSLGCSGTAVLPQKKLVLYAPVEPKLAEMVRQGFLEAHPEYKLQLVYQPQEQAQAQLVLASESLLRSLKQEGKLRPLPKSQRPLCQLEGDVEGYWQNFFYDPAVLLINQRFARQVGQRHLRSWSDLERLQQGRLVLENLSNSDSTRNFLGAYASRLGEEKAILSLKGLDARVEQYAQLPFSPVRMVAVGDADIALTCQSNVAKYLESSFPAYVVLPTEGSPVNLYGLAVLDQGEQVAAAGQLLDWLRYHAQDYMSRQEQETGFFFLANTSRQAVVPGQLWQNTEYLDPEKEKYISDHWLQAVRFGKRS